MTSQKQLGECDGRYVRWKWLTCTLITVITILAGLSFAGGKWITSIEIEQSIHKSKIKTIETRLDNNHKLIIEKLDTLIKRKN